MKIPLCSLMLFQYCKKIEPIRKTSNQIEFILVVAFLGPKPGKMWWDIANLEHTASKTGSRSEEIPRLEKIRHLCEVSQYFSMQAKVKTQCLPYGVNLVSILGYGTEARPYLSIASYAKQCWPEFEASATAIAQRQDSNCPLIQSWHFLVPGDSEPTDTGPYAPLNSQVNNPAYRGFGMLVGNNHHIPHQHLLPLT
jgi:hypothetical protein